VAERSIAAVC